MSDDTKDPPEVADFPITKVTKQGVGWLIETGTLQTGFSTHEQAASQMGVLQTMILGERQAYAEQTAETVSTTSRDMYSQIRPGEPSPEMRQTVLLKAPRAVRQWVLWAGLEMHGLRNVIAEKKDDLNYANDELTELKSVIEAMDEGDNPDLWGTLVKERNTLKAEVAALQKQRLDEAAEYNAGWDAAKDGKPIGDDPSPPYDEWQSGWCAFHGNADQGELKRLREGEAAKIVAFLERPNIRVRSVHGQGIAVSYEGFGDLKGWGSNVIDAAKIAMKSEREWARREAAQADGGES